MARFRLPRLAKADLARILASNAERCGAEGQPQYAALIAIAMRQVANDPEGRAIRGRDDLLRSVRSFHVRHARADDLKPKVKKPVHIVYYRAVAPGQVEIIRVLHEHMEPSRYVGESSEE
jgi:toxin ParE1/3/4